MAMRPPTPHATAIIMVVVETPLDWLLGDFLGGGGFFLGALSSSIDGGFTVVGAGIGEGLGLVGAGRIVIGTGDGGGEGIGEGEGGGGGGGDGGLGGGGENTIGPGSKVGSPKSGTGVTVVCS